MLKEVNETTITILCDICHHESQDDISDKKLEHSEFLPESYNDYGVICPNCQTITFFNMNLPPIEEDYPLELMPEKEQINRTNVRKLKELLLKNE